MLLLVHGIWGFIEYLCALTVSFILGSVTPSPLMFNIVHVMHSICDGGNYQCLYFFISNDAGIAAYNICFNYLINGEPVHVSSLLHT